MGKLTIRDFRPQDVQAAAQLLAASHARAQTHLDAAGSTAPRLSERYFEPRACRVLIEQLVSSPRTRAVVAERDGHVCGYLAGEKQLFAPEEFASIYAEPRSTNVPLHGHAVEAGVDECSEVYEAMYTELASRWVAEGFFGHNVAMRAGEREVADAWSAVGFGRKSLCAVRATSATGAARDRRDADAGVVIEEIRGRDDEVLELFHRRLMTFQTGAPMFWPYTGESDARVRAVRRDALVGGQGLAYVARTKDGDAVGSLLFVPAVFLSPLLVCEKMIYLWEGFVEEGARTSGVGSALLDHALASLHERGLKWCALHFVSGNPRGGRFWPSKGFEPVEVVMHRHVDERVAWARGNRV